MAVNPRKPTVDAQKAEALDAPTVVEFNGKEYTVPAALDLPVEVLEAVSELDVLSAILGEKQYKAFRATKPNLRDLKTFGELVANAAGFDDMGE